MTLPTPLSDGGWIGRSLQDRYRIESELGRGGMGIVYLAHDERLGRRVVVKVPLPELLNDRDVRARFLREVEELARHEHPHIVRILDFGELDGYPYAVVEYVAGGSLEDRLRAAGGRQTPHEILAWLPQVAAALDSMHAQGALHRDVKPGNILFGESGHAYLADFGIATAMASADDVTQIGGQALTQTGVFVGSGAYAPPESISRTLTPAYDVYSLGVVVYQALTSAMPFQGDTVESILIAKASQPPISLRDTCSDVSPPVAKAVMRALDRDLEKRYPTCTAFADAFEWAADGNRIRKRRGPPGWSLALALVGVAAAAGWWWLQQAPHPAFLAEMEETRTDTARVRIEEPEPPVVMTEPGRIRFRAGSTPPEIQAAMDLCRDHVSGCDRDWYADETLRDVTLDPVELDLTEVTNGAFARFVEQTGYRTGAEARGTSHHGPLVAHGLSWRAPDRAGARAEDRPRHPVVHVSLRDAEGFCAHVGARLPSEDEWEFAARGPERRVFPWGGEWSGQRAVWRSADSTGLQPVGSRPAGADLSGHQDMAGSVWEWTATSTGADQILKGGSWLERNPANLRSAARLRLDPEHSSSDVGFRCARDVPQ